MSADDNGGHSINVRSLIKIIGALCSHNTSGISSIKEHKKDGAGEPVHDAGDDAIASHQKSMFLVQSCLIKEQGQNKWWIMDWWQPLNKLLLTLRIPRIL